MTITLPDELFEEFNDLELTFQRYTLPYSTYVRFTVSDKNGELFDGTGDTPDDAAEQLAINAELWITEQYGNSNHAT